MPHHRLIPRPSHPSHPSKPSKPPSKPQKTISTASILKRKPMATLHTHRHRASRRRRREKSREGKSGHPLMRDYEDDVAKCRESAQSNAVAALATAHTDLLTKVGAVKTTNTTLLSTLQTQFSALLLPLNDTEIATTGNATRGVSEQIESFRAQLAAGERELKRLWALWDEAQGEIEKLGREGGGGVMKGWEEEVRERIGGMEREVEEAGREAVRGMGEAEKEIDKKLRDEQAKLVAMMFGEE